jgi:large subunit ribosomal protein L4
VTTSLRSNARHNTAQVKDRGAVRGGGKKPWRQKGTGRARHGSSRSPIWRGGGVTHGPTAERNYFKKINRGMKIKALYTILSQKQRDGEILWVDEVKMAKPATKTAQTTLNTWAKLDGFAPLAYGRGRRALLVLPTAEANVEKSFRNLPAVTTERVSGLNPVDLLTYRYVVMVNPESVLKHYANR